jgi:hypothetical protein
MEDKKTAGIKTFDLSMKEVKEKIETNRNSPQINTFSNSY